MRPIELELRGFTCFKTQARVDFRGLDLFAITGPTGAGKTSLLEAMIYSLYGRSPRVSNEIKHLLALGSDKALVDYTFSSGPSIYRVVRTFTKKGQSEARLEEKGPDEKFISLAAGSRDVTAQVEKLLGLDYEAFVRTVVLPQGRFDEFLKGQASDRQRILSSLLDLGIYEKMRKRAGEQLSLADTRLKDLESRLQELSHATAENLGQARSQKEAREAEANHTAEEHQQTEAEAQQAREAAELGRALEKARAGLVRLEQAAPALEQKRARLARARQAQPLVPLWRALRQAGERAQQEAKEAEQRQRQRRDAESRAQAAEAAYASASTAAQEIPALEAEIARLREAVTQSQLYKAKRDELARVAARAKQAQDALAKAQQGFAQRTREADLARKDVEALGRDQARLRPAEEAEQALAETARAEAEYARARHAWTQARGAQKIALEVAHKAKLEAEAAATEHENTEALYRAAQEALASAQAALDEARREDMASSLRRHLVAGDRCPVCRGEVKRVPGSPAPNLDHAEEDLRAAQQRQKAADQRREKARQRASALQAEAAGAEARAIAAQRVLDEAQGHGEERSRARDAALQQLRAALSGPNPDPELVPLLAPFEGGDARRDLKPALDALAQALGARERQAAALDAALQEAQKRIRRAEEEAARLEGRLSRAQEELSSATADETRSSAEAEALAQKLAGIDGDPEELLGQRSRRRDAVARALSEAEQGRALSAARAADLVAQSDEAQQRAARAEEERAEQEREFSPKLAAAGFQSEEELSQAALPEEQLRSLQNELSAHDQQRQQLAAEESRLIEALGSRVPDPARAEQLAQRARELQQQSRKLAVEIGAMTQKIQALEEAIARRQALQVEEGKLRKDHERAGRLARDLSNDKFQSFVLDEAFRFLAEDGSRQLHRLSSERYTFDVRDREFYVLDHWNAAEARTVRTLSGGETFLASLALSVALAERIHDLSTTTTGDRMLESLFLDEGFGTLDPESLDVVIAALEELRTTGRMVGVISHVPELTARLPSRIVVDKNASGSVISQEGGG